MAKVEFTSNIDSFIKDAKGFQKGICEELYATTIRDVAKWIGARAVTEYSIKTKGLPRGRGKGVGAPWKKEAHPTKFTWRTGALGKALMGVYHRTMRDSQLLIKTQGRNIIGIMRINLPYAKAVEEGLGKIKKKRPFLAPATKDAEKVIPIFWNKNLKKLGKKWGFKTS